MRLTVRKYKPRTDVAESLQTSWGMLGLLPRANGRGGEGSTGAINTVVTQSVECTAFSFLVEDLIK